MTTITNDRRDQIVAELDAYPALIAAEGGTENIWEDVIRRLPEYVESDIEDDRSNRFALADGTEISHGGRWDWSL